MVFGLLKDIKKGEYRTIATPVEIASIKADGHTVLVQKGAGERAGFSDESYVEAGAEIVDTAKEMYERCDFITKVKELEPYEFDMLREGQVIFTCIHPAAHREEVQALLDKKLLLLQQRTLIDMVLQTVKQQENRVLFLVLSLCSQ